MKLQPVPEKSTENYPTLPPTKGVTLKHLLIGASITAAMALTACAKKKDQSSSKKASDTKETTNEVVTPDTPNKTPPKVIVDSDGDGVPDNKDKCINKKGPSATNGCPKPKPHPVRLGGVARRVEPITGKILPKVTDSDGDGVPDKLDKCPKRKGPKSRHGCPKPRLKGKVAHPRLIK